MCRPGVIAIDGPVASGKSVVGRMLARKLGYRFLDTGSMYRAATWAALNQKVDMTREEELSHLAATLRMEIVSSPEERERLLVNGEDVTDRLRDARVEEWVSPVAVVPGVREALVKEQRKLAQGGKMVMVGRDIGTVVLPQAPLKVFLVASPEERTRRRYQELKGLGMPADYTRVREEVARRDRMDTERVLSPLRPAPDAHILDTEGLTVEEVVERIISLIEGC